MLRRIAAVPEMTLPGRLVAQTVLPPGAIRRGNMHGALSTYFDFIRFTAAVVVLLSHVGPMVFGLPEWMFPGHDAVVVFFVLSGYVIAFAADGRDGVWPVYGVNRLSRLWSVSLPALCLGVAIAAWIAPAKTGAIAAAAIVNALFLGEWWTGDWFAPANPPMWSLNYEAWYYLIFAAWIFLSGRQRIVWTIVACVAAGPKIVALLPVWLIGVLLYRRRPTVARPVAWALLTFSVLGYGVVYHIQLQILMQTLLKAITAGQSYHLGPSASLMSDYIVVVLVIANFVAVDNLTRSVAVVPKVKSVIAWLASYTLTIYLFHMPLTILLHGAFALGGAATMVAMVALLLTIGSVTEHKRNVWRIAIEAVIAGARSIRQRGRLVNPAA